MTINEKKLKQKQMNKKREKQSRDGKVCEIHVVAVYCRIYLSSA